MRESKERSKELIYLISYPPQLHILKSLHELFTVNNLVLTLGV